MACVLKQIIGEWYNFQFNIYNAIKIRSVKKQRNLLLFVLEARKTWKSAGEKQRFLPRVEFISHLFEINIGRNFYGCSLIEVLKKTRLT